MAPDYPLDYACELCHVTRDKDIITPNEAFLTDQVGWRCLVPAERLKHIPDLPLTNTSWWYGKAKSLWLSPIDADLSNLTDIEFTARVFNEPPVPGETVSWGKKVNNAKVLSRFNVSFPQGPVAREGSAKS
jgi:hypothetical protein